MTGNLIIGQIGVRFIHQSSVAHRLMQYIQLHALQIARMPKETPHWRVFVDLRFSSATPNKSKVPFQALHHSSQLSEVQNS